MFHPLRSLPRWVPLTVAFGVALAISLGVLACGEDDPYSPPGNGGSGNTINVLATSFSPASKTISVNQTITWKFNGGSHTVTQGTSPGNPASPLFDSGSRTSGTFTFTFDTPGTYEYFCAFHFNTGMTGTITVEP